MMPRRLSSPHAPSETAHQSQMDEGELQQARCLRLVSGVWSAFLLELPEAILKFFPSVLPLLPVAGFPEIELHSDLNRVGKPCRKIPAESVRPHVHRFALLGNREI